MLLPILNSPPFLIAPPALPRVFNAMVLWLIVMVLTFAIALAEFAASYVKNGAELAAIVLYRTVMMPLVELNRPPPSRHAILCEIVLLISKRLLGITLFGHAVAFTSGSPLGQYIFFSISRNGN